MTEEEGPRCHFCGEPIGEGSKLREKELYLCYDCRELLHSWLEDALPTVMRDVMDDAEDAMRENFVPCLYDEKTGKVEVVKPAGEDEKK